MTKLKDVHVECEFHGKDFESCKQYSGQFACEPVTSVIEDKYLCDCHRNHGKDCLFPEKYRKEGCN